MTASMSSLVHQLDKFSIHIQDGIAIVAIDQPRKMNVLGDGFSEDLRTIVDAFIADNAIKGMILTSAKDTFIVGADIDQLATISTAEQAFEFVEGFKKVLRHLETAGKPVVAAMTGSALGGGFEVALGCHYRIAIDSPKTKLGLPEVKLGLLPGGGGTQRVLRLVGIQKALELMTQGTELRPEAAKQLGLIDDVAHSRDEMIEKAIAWINAHPQAQQPWDVKGFKVPKGDGAHPAIVQVFSIAPAMANQKSHGNYPAIGHIMSCVYEGSLVDIDTGLQIESRYFAACVLSKEARSLIGTMWLQLNSIKKGQSRPQGVPKHHVRKVGILGAGMMGAGIAYVSAKADIEVVLLDTNQENADKGKAYSAKILDKAISHGKSTTQNKDALLANIHTTTDYADLTDCDLIIEAVFEDRDIKAQAIRQTDAVIASDTIFASNTSTLPITGLAASSVRPKQFIGLHFFSPVDKMPLVEIIMGEHTDQDTLAKSFDYVLQIGKTPIVVNDSRGFYTTRVFSAYVLEGTAMLSEGIHPRSIEVAGIKAGMPIGPLALQDEVSLGLMLHINAQTRKDFAAEGKPFVEHPAQPALAKIGEELGRVGKKAGKGFYDYPTTGEKQLWSGLTAVFPVKAQQPSQQELIDRLLFIQANETAKCFEEKVVLSVADANIGSIFGWGFAPHQGGTLQFINNYGVARFVKRAQELADQYGERFKPAQILVDMAAKGQEFKDA